MYKYSEMSTDILGTIYIFTDDEALIDISLSKEDWEVACAKYEATYAPDDSVISDIKNQLEEYFEGKRKTFSFPISYNGTSFQEQVWTELMNIPYGETRCYADIAKAIDNPKAVRAIGQANRRNPIPIVVPCHRVIGKDRSLTGYAGTRTDLKEKLLKLEGVLE